MKQFIYWLIPVLRMAEMNLRILSLVVTLTAYRKKASLYSLSLHTPKALYTEPFRSPWTRAFPTDAARPGCLPEPAGAV